MFTFFFYTVSSENLVWNQKDVDAPIGFGKVWVQETIRLSVNNNLCVVTFYLDHWSREGHTWEYDP